MLAGYETGRGRILGSKGRLRCEPRVTSGKRNERQITKEGSLDLFAALLLLAAADCFNGRLF